MDIENPNVDQNDANNLSSSGTTNIWQIQDVQGP